MEGWNAPLGKQIIKKEMSQLSENIIRFIQVDTSSENGGFIFVVSSEYDTQFSVMKSNNPKY